MRYVRTQLGNTAPIFTPPVVMSNTMQLTDLSNERSRKNSQPLTVESFELKNVTVREIIGSGSFSTVHEVDVVWPEVDRREDQRDGQKTTKYVAKQLRIGKDNSYLKRIESVCTSLWPPGRRRVEHPNIVRFVGVWFRPGAKPELPMLVFEKMDKCLAEFLKTNTEQCVLLTLLNDVASGLEFLHYFKVPIVHGDLTAYSIFIKRHSDCLVAKIGDLGVCQILDKGVCPSNSCSSYRSPEACSMRSHVPDKTDDIYACGVLMMHTLLQEYPASRKPGDPRQFSRYLDRLKEHPLHSCIVACLNKNPSERPPAKGVLVTVEAAVCHRISHQYKDQAEVQEKLKKISMGNKQLSILITGKTGSGKSSLTNGLVGKTVAKEGEKLISSTRHVNGYAFCHGDVKFLVVDSPGLQDLETEDKETFDFIKRQLVCISNSFDLVIYCIDMTSKRVDRSDKLAIRHLTECFGESIWENAVFTLTFANYSGLQLPPDFKGTEEEWFTEKLQEFKTVLYTILTEANVSRNLAKKIPLVPAGYWKPVERIPNPWKLPDRPDWFNVFWLTCALRMEESASMALFRSQEPRIIREPLTESQLVENAIERLIFVPSECVNEEKGVYIPKVRVAAGSFTGMAIGASLGALLGVPGGPLGIAVVGAAGAATGAVFGGSVVAGAHVLRHHTESQSTEQPTHHTIQ